MARLLVVVLVEGMVLVGAAFAGEALLPSLPSSGTVVGLEGSCQPYAGTLCTQLLDASATFWVPTSVTMEDGSEHEATQAWLEEKVASGFASLQTGADLVAPECSTASYESTCTTHFRRCEERGGRAFPVKDCSASCELLWGHCSATYQFALSIGIADVLPRCGVLESGSTFHPDAYGDVADIVWPKIAPADMLGQVYFSPEPTYTVDGHVFTCVADRQASDASGGVDVACVANECVFPFMPPRPRDDAQVGVAGNVSGADGCPTCDTVCPMNPFEPGTDFRVIAQVEQWLAIAPMPLLVALLAIEAFRGRRANPFLTIACLAGLAYCVLIAAIVDPDATGCPTSGGFGLNGRAPEWWKDSPAMEQRCTVMALAVHLLQLLLCSGFCVFLEMYWSFCLACNFQTYRRNTCSMLSVYAAIVFGVPGASLATTVALGRHQHEDIFSAGFSYLTVRDLYRCRTGLKGVARWLVIALPMLAPLVGCVVVCSLLYRQCQAVLRVEGNSNSKSANARNTARLARKMVVFCSCSLLLLVVQIGSEVHLQSVFDGYTASLNTFLICTIDAVGGGSDCTDVVSFSRKEFNVIIVNVATESCIPLLLSVLFIGTVLLKEYRRWKLRRRKFLKRRRRQKKRTRVQPASVLESLASLATSTNVSTVAVAEDTPKRFAYNVRSVLSPPKSPVHAVQAVHRDQGSDLDPDPKTAKAGDNSVNSFSDFDSSSLSTR